MRSPFHIDPMTADDAGAVAALENPMHLEERALREELGRPWARLWVARSAQGTARASEVVGHLTSWHVADELHVLNIATREDWRRRGVGRGLMDAAVAYARGHAVRHLLLEVRLSNHAAVALYRQVGFFAARRRARYYPDGEDAAEMVLALDPATGSVVRREDEVPLGRAPERMKE